MLDVLESCFGGTLVNHTPWTLEVIVALNHLAVMREFTAEASNRNNTLLGTRAVRRAMTQAQL